MHKHRLFIACFVALIATAFGFIIRAMIIDTWGEQFNLSETQKGEIFGVGLWPFAISIVLFSLVIDRIGYGRAMVFALACHCISGVVTIGAGQEWSKGFGLHGYWGLYLGNLIVALGNGTIEAVINPVVATMYAKEKTKWLNILHAGWPGGLVLGGLILLWMGPGVPWEYKVALIFVPTALYAVLLIGCKFPVNERVAAGVSYRDMLREFGALGALIVSALIVFQVARVFEEMQVTIGGEQVRLLFNDREFWTDSARLYVKWGIVLGLAIAFGAYCRSLGRPIFVFMLLIMIPLATTELGTDSWITPLMEPQMKELGLQAGWVLVYTSAIMMVLRFFAGPIVHRFSPLGLLAISAVLAAVGLVALSKSTGLMILVAATIYGFGKTFFWPTMLGVVAEQSPKGGSLTLNATGGVGMLGVGVVGAVFLGLIQDQAINSRLEAENPAMHAALVVDKESVFGRYRAIDTSSDAFKALDEAQKEEISSVEKLAKKEALMTVAIFPVIMLVCYLIMIFYFKARGGYKAEVLVGHAAEDEKFTGGVEGPADA